jgi:hypothetical protein
MRVRRAAMVAGVLLLWAAAACGPVSAGSSSTSLGPAGLAGSVTLSGGWGNAELVPGLESLDKDQKPQVGGISCASAGSCALGGSYLLPDSDYTRAFVANAGGEAQVNSVSCNQPGPCTAGGFYKRQHGPNQGFVVSWS